MFSDYKSSDDNASGKQMSLINQHRLNFTLHYLTNTTLFNTGRHFEHLIVSLYFHLLIFYSLVM